MKRKVAVSLYLVNFIKLSLAITCTLIPFSHQSTTYHILYFLVGIICGPKYGGHFPSRIFGGPIWGSFADPYIWPFYSWMTEKSTKDHHLRCYDTRANGQFGNVRRFSKIGGKCLRNIWSPIDYDRTYFTWIMAFYIEGRLFLPWIKIIFMYLVSLNCLLESLLEVWVLFGKSGFSKYTFRGVSRPSNVARPV